MKASIYNLFFSLNGAREYILFNAFSGRIAAVDAELKTLFDELAAGRATSVGSGMLADFKAAGFLVDEDVDETKIYEVQYGLRKYASQELWVNVMTTYACNLACPYCYQGHGDILDTTMTPQTADAVLQFVKTYSRESNCRKISLMLYGGEPLLNPRQAFQLIDGLKAWADDNGVDFGSGFITNGTLFTPEVVERMKATPQRINQLTLDGPKHIHDRRRIRKNGQGTYDRIIQSLELLSEHRIPNVFLRIDVDKDNASHMDELLDDLKARSLQHIPIGFGLIQAKSQACSSWWNFCLRGEESKLLLPDIWRKALDRGFDVRLRPHVFFVYCGAQTNFSIMIDPSGDVYKCSNFLGQREHRVGSIREDGSMTGLNYEYFDWMSRNPLAFEACRACTYLPLCGGGCAGLAFKEHGTFHREICGEIKSILEDQLKLYLHYQWPAKFKNGRYLWD